MTARLLIVSLRLLIYGQYCSHMENAQKTLDELIATREDVKIKVEVMTTSRGRANELVRFCGNTQVCFVILN